MCIRDRREGTGALLDAADGNSRDGERDYATYVDLSLIHI